MDLVCLILTVQESFFQWFFFVDSKWEEKNGGQVKLFKPLKKAHENNWRNERIDEKDLEIIKIVAPSPKKYMDLKKLKILIIL